MPPKAKKDQGLGETQQEEKEKKKEKDPSKMNQLGSGDHEKEDESSEEEKSSSEEEGFDAQQLKMKYMVGEFALKTENDASKTGDLESNASMTNNGSQMVNNNLSELKNNSLNAKELQESKIKISEESGAPNTGRRDSSKNVEEKAGELPLLEQKKANTRNILAGNEKLDWEIADRKDAIKRKLDNMNKLQQKNSEKLPFLSKAAYDRRNNANTALSKLNQSQFDDPNLTTQKPIQTGDKKIKIIGQEKASKSHHPSNNSTQNDAYYYPSVKLKKEPKDKALAEKSTINSHIPNAFERKQIRENIKVVLDHNFNISLNNKKTGKHIEKMEEDYGSDERGGKDGIVKYLEKDFEDYENRGKYDRKVFRRRSQVKQEIKNIRTEEDIQDQAARDQLRRNNNARKEPGMIDMIREIPGDKQTADFDKPRYLDNEPLDPRPAFEAPATRDIDDIDADYVRPLKKTGESFYVVVFLVVNGPDGTGWRSYEYDLAIETTKIIDLKIKVEIDLGYTYQDQHYYFNLRLVNEEDDLRNLDFKCDIWSKDSIALIMIPSKEPSFNRQSTTRVKYLPVPVTDLFPANGPFAKTSQEFLNSNVLKYLLFPPNRDWTEEFYVNYRQVKKLLLEIKQKDKEIGTKKYLGPRLSECLTRLAIHTKGMEKTLKEFDETAMKCIEIVNKWEVKPHEINYIYGVGGTKHAMGGMVIKECKVIYSMGRKITDGETIGALINHKIEMLNWIRNATDSFVVPLASAFEYYGRYYVAYAAVPIDMNSLVYGTISQNLVIVNDLNDHQPLQELSRLLNLNFHYVYESGMDNFKPIYGSSNWEIHRVKDLLYITDVDRLLPLDFIEDSEIRLEGPFLANFLPMQVVQSSVSRNIDESYSKVGSRDTFKCSECRQYIPDQEYYSYDRGTSKSGEDPSEGYNCCLNDYRKKSVYHDLKVSVGKLKKKKFKAVSLGEFYVNNQTGDIVEDIPYQKVPLNCDIIEAQETPEEITAQIKNDKLNIKYLANNLRSTKCQDFAEKFQRFEEDVGTCRDISGLLKSRGIPIRYLGKIAEHCDKNFAKEIIVREMVARAMAHILTSSFEYLRRLANEMKEFNLKKNIAFHLNNLFTSEENDDSKTEWRTIIDYIRLIFDTIVEVNVKQKVHFPGLLIRILELIDAKLVINLDDVDFSDSSPFKISYFEIFHPRPVAKFDSMFVYEFFTNLAKFYQKIGRRDSWWITTGDEVEASIFFYNQGANMARLVFGESSPNILPYLFNLATISELKHQEKGRPEFSSWNRSAKIPDDKHSSVSRYNYNKIISIMAENRLCEDVMISDCYQGLARLVKDNKFELIQIQNTDGYADYRGEANLFYLKKATAILETLCSSEHPIVASCYAMISFCYHDNHKIFKATLWMRKAFCLFFITLGTGDDVTQKCYNHLLRLEGALSSKYQFLPLDQLAISLIDYLENEAHLEDDDSDMEETENKDLAGEAVPKAKALGYET